MNELNLNCQLRSLEVLISEAPVNPTFSALLSIFVERFACEGYDPEVIYEDGNPLPVIRCFYNGKTISVYLRQKVVEAYDERGFDELEVCFLVDNRRFKRLHQASMYIHKTYPIKGE